MSKKSLYLVDGSTLIFRAYFAIRHLSNSKGLPTNAVYGFTSMLRKLIRDYSPDYLVVVFDKGSKTFRVASGSGGSRIGGPLPLPLPLPLGMLSVGPSGGAACVVAMALAFA